MPDFAANINNRQPHRSEEVVIDFQPQSSDNTSALGQTADTSQAGGLSTLTVNNSDNTAANSITIPHSVQDFNMIESVIKDCISNIIKWNVLSLGTGLIALLSFELKFSYLYLLILLWLYYAYNIATLVYNKPNRTM